MSSSSREQLENWLKTLEVKGKVLDIGGSVQTLEGRVKNFKPTEYLIMDNGAEKDSHEKWNEPDYSVSIESFGNQTIADSKNKFDQIFMIEVSEYLINPLMAVTNSHYMIKKGGKFYSSWHFVYPKHQPEETDFLRYTDWGVRKLHEIAGFKDIKITPRYAENDLAGFYRAERMRGMKGIEHNIIGYMCEALK